MRGCVAGFRGLRFKVAGKSCWDTRGAVDRLDLLPVELRFPRSCTVRRASGWQDLGGPSPSNSNVRGHGGWTGDAAFIDSGMVMLAGWRELCQAGVY